MIINSLKKHGIEAQLVSEKVGPSVLTYEIKLHSPIKKLERAARDLAANLLVTNVNVWGPIAGRGTFAVEVPRNDREFIKYKEALALSDPKGRIPFLLGKDQQGEIRTADLAKLPHLLVAGATGSGKSVFINNLIKSINFYEPNSRFLLIDPKRVELESHVGNVRMAFGVNHTYKEVRESLNALNDLIDYMEEVYKILNKEGVKQISESGNKRLNPIIAVIDEFADLMMTSKCEVEDKIIRLAQKGRAAGIHLVIATQRPTANVVTGLVKSNIVGRAAFNVTTKTDSRVILDESGAENLLGNGDMIYKDGRGEKIRIQGAF
jgi:S-DNA-T family DNA segregation ATPase FtsK/SpoIIIE